MELALPPWSLGSSTTVYRSGTFVDLCRGPHLPNTGKIKAFALTKASAALWLGKQGNDELQRVYGISFGEKKELQEWKTLQEEAAKRDHRRIGEQQELLFFDDLSPGVCLSLPQRTIERRLIADSHTLDWGRRVSLDCSPGTGSCFFLPHGCRIYNKLMEIIREQYDLSSCSWT